LISSVLCIVGLDMVWSVILAVFFLQRGPSTSALTAHRRCTSSCSRAVRDHGRYGRGESCFPFCCPCCFPVPFDISHTLTQHLVTQMLLLPRPRPPLHPHLSISISTPTNSTTNSSPPQIRPPPRGSPSTPLLPALSQHPRGTRAPPPAHPRTQTHAGHSQSTKTHSTIPATNISEPTILALVPTSVY
jgi:hypothetical protein